LQKTQKCFFGLIIRRRNPGPDKGDDVRLRRIKIERLEEKKTILWREYTKKIASQSKKNQIRNNVIT
jgi:hypothetical protein